MDKIEALSEIKESWNSTELSLGDKIIKISDSFYSNGLDLSTTAAYIKATPAELDSFLSLGAFDEDIIQLIAQVNPPKTTWTFLANASDDEIVNALKMLKSNRETRKDANIFTFSELVYQSMLEVSGPTIEQRVSDLSSTDIKHAREKGEAFGALNDWQIKFLKSLAARKGSGKALTEKQIPHLITALNDLIEKGAISRNSIDGDQEFCNRILDALGK